MEKDKEFQERLVRRYINNQATDEELEAYFHLLQQGALDDYLEKYMKEDEDAFLEHHQTHRSPIRRIRIQVAAAVAVLIFLSVGSLLFLLNKRQTEGVVLANDVAPGGNKATLTLADGRMISLIEADNGQLAIQSGAAVMKAANGQLVYVAAENEVAGPTSYNTIVTPRGGQYQIVLPDGSKVWLNAASSLKYPVTFAGLNERRVELTGEGYFEVEKDKNRPFLVESAQQTVEVLGTQFNVNVYPDEPAIKTTLLEGRVRLAARGGTSAVTLSPGDQAIRKGAGFRIVEVDPEQAIAWKNDKFVFDRESLQSILRKVGRWYDVEIEFQDLAAKGILFGGTMSRFDHISKVLNKLEVTGNVQFEMVQETDAAPPKVVVKLKR
ncbi:FecR domain-containing protein [Olivibacter sp. SDN3]|uniref:FecR family protein n=1 Tax=Olivibacter sp. SDN3 TaxID=2764720 RepID=UPI0016518C8A|nr:FecR family protein [Olivibacter sp. SDN3]QNL48809.1 FecR domain-containing protein [Olivibacter sp. SDN3]